MLILSAREYSIVIKKLLFLGLLSYGVADLQGVIAVGDTDDASTTFQFSVGSAIYNAANQQLWTLSGEDTSSLSSTVQAYGISYTPFIQVDGSLDLTLKSYPYLSTQATITTVTDGALVVPSSSVTNPLLGQEFSAVSFLGKYVTVVKATAPRFVYLIQSVFFSDGAALGRVSVEGTSTINELDLGVTHQVKALAGSGLGTLFIANAQGTFGTDSSNISFAATSTSHAELNGQTTSLVAMIKQADEAVTLSTPVLIAGGSDLETIGSSVTMYPSPMTALQVYVGLDVNAPAGAAQAVGLCTATAVSKTETVVASIEFGSVLPDSVASAGLQTPVSASANRRVVVSDVTATMTSTGLSYLVTGRYDGIGSQSIYAMPMVTMSSDASQNGMIADFSSIDQTFEIVGRSYRVQGFDTVISDATQIDIESSDAVISTRLQVGGGSVPLPTGQFVQQIVAQGDSVFITIQNAFGIDTTPGMFKSQALFDAQGRIMTWSPWQRVAGTDDQMLFAMKNQYTDATMYVSGANSDTIKQSTWNSNTALTSFIGSINDSMPLSDGGVQGLVPVSNHTTGLTETPLVIATGSSDVVISQTGSISSGNLIIDSPQTTITLNDSLGLDVGSIVTSSFADNGTSRWLFMGGDAGLSVLSDDTTGITFTGILTDLTLLTATGMSCKTLGSFKFVKKVVADQNFIYILTIDAVYRIDLVATKFTLTTPTALDAEIVMQASTIGSFASCLDMVIDNNLMILGTTQGLYSVDLTTSLPATPVSITVPGGLSTISKLFTISNNANFNQEFYESSNLYVLTINFGVQQARLNRFTISNGVVAPIQDQLLQGQNGPLLIFDYMSNDIFIDGSFGFATSYRIGSLVPTVKYLESTLRAGTSSVRDLLPGSTANLSIAAVVSSLGITGIARDYASGSLMLSANFGLLTDS